MRDRAGSQGGYRPRCIPLDCTAQHPPKLRSTQNLRTGWSWTQAFCRRSKMKSWGWDGLDSARSVPRDLMKPHRGEGRRGHSPACCPQSEFSAPLHPSERKTAHQERNAGHGAKRLGPARAGGCPIAPAWQGAALSMPKGQQAQDPQWHSSPRVYRPRSMRERPRALSEWVNPISRCVPAWAQVVSTDLPATSAHSSVSSRTQRWW